MIYRTGRNDANWLVIKLVRAIGKMAYRPSRNDGRESYIELGRTE